MKKLVLIIPLIALTSCGPTQCPFAENQNKGEPTLQSAEDAMKKDFTEDSFK